MSLIYKTLVLLLFVAVFALTTFSKGYETGFFMVLILIIFCPLVAFALYYIYGGTKRERLKKSLSTSYIFIPSIYLAGYFYETFAVML